MPSLWRSAAGAAIVLSLLAALLTGLPAPAAADSAPPVPSDPPTVTADVLPTPQINGVAWTQVVAAGRVYVGGDFTRARPFGATNADC